MTQHLAPSKETSWLACREKSCCYAAFVLPTGRDIWRITAALQAPPWTYTVYFQSPPRPDSFILDRSGMHFRVALSKGRTRRKKGPPPCIFLLKTRAGHHRCGLGDLRPQVCRSFPSEMVSGVLCLRNDGGCTCRVWSLSDVDITEETERVQTRVTEFHEYCRVVQDWNRRVMSAPPDVTYDYYEFCDFVLQTYAALDSGLESRAKEPGDAATVGSAGS